MPATLDEILGALKSLEPFPGVARSVLELSASDDAVALDLVAVIRTDPGITAKVLKLCNSAYYGFQREIASIDEAGVLLGVSVLVNLVLTSATSRCFRDYGSASREAHRRLWRECLTNALASRLIAARHGQADGERAYTAGLLQNMGKLVLERFLEREREAVRVAIQAGAPAVEAEREVLGVDHAEIGARLAGSWGLPEVLVDTIRHHHAPERATVAPRLAATIHLAERFARAVEPVRGPAGAGDAAFGEDSPDQVRAALRVTGLAPADLDALERPLLQELVRAQDFLLV